MKYLITFMLQVAPLALLLLSCAKYESVANEVTPASTRDYSINSNCNELAGFVPLDNSQRSKVVVYRKQVQPGSYIALVQAEVTSELPFAVGVGRQLNINGASIKPPVMSNVTLETHHLVINYASTVTVDTPSVVEFLVYAVSYSGRLTDKIRVEQCYGYMDIFKIN